MKFAVVVFPGTNCDMDCHYVVKEVLGEDADYVWHTQEDLSPYHCIILPGGFSYGDYLRTGAIAKLSPVMESVRKEAEKGKLVIGICNGFQILVEAGLLPGALLKNTKLRFLCKFVYLRLDNNDTPFTHLYKKGEVLRMPIAHFEGRYFAPPEVLDTLERNGQVVLRYSSSEGELVEGVNPNGSLNFIAGIVNEKRNVFGLMPHPERCSEKILSSDDGYRIFKSMAEWARTHLKEL
ncbi:phosphoribosylformylglycinamidine synthase I [bacterium]|nr:phosphoribosylformylglycinamidine synthase I [bacterium]